MPKLKRLRENIPAESKVGIRGRSTNWLSGQVTLGTSPGPGAGAWPGPTRNLTLEHRESGSESHGCLRVKTEVQNQSTAVLNSMGISGILKCDMFSTLIFSRPTWEATTITRSTNQFWLPFIKHLLGARQYIQYHSCIISSNPQNNSVRQVLLLIISV